LSNVKSYIVILQVEIIPLQITIYVFFFNTIDTFIEYTFAEALLHIFTAVGSVAGTSMGCLAENDSSFELGPACLTASQLANADIIRTEKIRS
jgi:hypothetical protein